MPQPLRFKYSINSALLGILMPLVFGAITWKNLMASYQYHVILGILVIITCDLIFLSYLVFVFAKRLLPAFQGKTALELNEQGITDYIRNIVIEWSYVQDLAHEYGRNSSKLIVKLNQETEYGTEIVIRLRWIRGKDRKIFDGTYAYFREINSLT
jgi:hypothetical protein